MEFFYLIVIYIVITITVKFIFDIISRDKPIIKLSIKLSNKKILYISFISYLLISITLLIFDIDGMDFVKMAGFLLGLELNILITNKKYCSKEKEI